MTTTADPPLRWTPILLEATFVVLGVVLALAANELRESRNRKQQAVTALESIRSELASNRQAVRAALTYHLQLIDSLRQYSQASSVSESPNAPGLHVFSRGYVAPAVLLRTAWEAATTTDAVANMEYADVLMLSSAYEEQRRYEDQARQTGGLIYARLFDEGHDGMRRNHANLSTIISALWYGECRLLASLQAALEQLAPDESAAQDGLPAMCQRVVR